jgi:hypothetical protein
MIGYQWSVILAARNTKEVGNVTAEADKEFFMESPDQPFKVRDCALITRMGGVDPAMNLRELRERVENCPVECIFHHFYETLIRPSFDDPEFRNDFAIWTSRELRDQALAERLGILNPYYFNDLEELRSKIVDVIDERLSEVSFIPWVPKGREFHFLRAVTVVFDTGVELHTPEELVGQIPKMSSSTIYYHFVEARRRTPDKSDDFTAWLNGLQDSPQDLIEAFNRIDFYFMTPAEMKNRLIAAAKEALGT